MDWTRTIYRKDLYTYNVWTRRCTWEYASLLLFGSFMKHNRPIVHSLHRFRTARLSPIGVRSCWGCYKSIPGLRCMCYSFNYLTIPMNSRTTYEVLALVVGPPAVAGVQRIMVQTQFTPRLILQTPTMYFPGNRHPHRMLGGIQQEKYCIFLDMEAHLHHPNDSTYVFVKIHGRTCEPLDVNPDTIIMNATQLLQR